jgi:hypothetical protein
MAIWYTLWPFGTLVVIWYIFPSFGILYQEIFGNPVLKQDGDGTVFLHERLLLIFSEYFVATRLLS